MSESCTMTRARYVIASVDLNGPTDASVSLMHCQDCGAFVAQPDSHDAWHDLNNEVHRLRAVISKARDALRAADPYCLMASLLHFELTGETDIVRPDPNGADEPWQSSSPNGDGG